MNTLFLIQGINEEEIFDNYIRDYPIDPDDVGIAYLPRDPKPKAAVCVEFIENLFQDESHPEYILTTSAPFFKALTGKSKAVPFIGYVVDGKTVPSKIIYIPNILALRRNPYEARNHLNRAMVSYARSKAGTYKDPGQDVIRSGKYLLKEYEIIDALDEYMKYPMLSCDIETKSLLFYEAGISTISFSINQHEGIAFPVDISTGNVNSDVIRKALKYFFDNYKGTLLFHNAGYDVTILIYELYMKGIGDQEGLLNGLEALDNIEDTKIISYLATNSCAGNTLGLKPQSIEYTGIYGLEDDEITNLEALPILDVLEYNLIDTLATWYVYNKNHPKMIADDQEGVYETIFRPALKDVIQMQLTGLPLQMEKVHELSVVLDDVMSEAELFVLDHPAVALAQHELGKAWAAKRNSELKVKRVTAEDYIEEFNLNSSTQLTVLLFDVLKLPVLKTTKTGAPATGKEILDNLVNHAEDESTKTLLRSIIEHKDAAKIATSFIPRMLSAPQGIDGTHYLFGNFNLGGTVSGRLSSSNVNLQNLPSSKSKYSKAFKDCFVAPEGKIFCGLDFDSLEDRISALTTKDPAKLDIYIKGYDGHSYRTYYYWPEMFDSIDPESVESINSIADIAPEMRQMSKTPTFALTYQGTYLTLIEKGGFPYEEAKKIEANYHSLYAVSDAWVQEQLKEGYEKGYVTVAFGMRVRTPLLKQVIGGTRTTPKEAEAEARTAGNALGQSWCMLNSRAGSEVMKKVRESKFRLKIRPCAQIHDAQYFLIDEDIETLQFLNEILREAVAWQEDPLIQHDEVKLSGSLGVFYPSWSNEVTLPKDIDSDIVNDLIIKSLEKLNAKQSKS